MVFLDYFACSLAIRAAKEYECLGFPHAGRDPATPIDQDDAGASRDAAGVSELFFALFHDFPDVDIGQPRTRIRICDAYAAGGPEPADSSWPRRRRTCRVPGGAWWRHFEERIAKRDGDTDKVERLKAEGAAEMAAMMQKFAKIL